MDKQGVVFSYNIPENRIEIENTGKNNYIRQGKDVKIHLKREVKAIEKLKSGVNHTRTTKEEEIVLEMTNDDVLYNIVQSMGDKS